MWLSAPINSKFWPNIVPDCGEDLFFWSSIDLGTTSELEAKFPLNFSHISNVFGQGCESVPPCKIFRFKYRPLLFLIMYLEFIVDWSKVTAMPRIRFLTFFLRPLLSNCEAANVCVMATLFVGLCYVVELMENTRTQLDIIDIGHRWARMR